MTIFAAMSSIRQQKVERLLQKELSTLFVHERVTMFGGIYNTITAVRVSPDMSVAKVYVSVMDIEHKQSYIDELNGISKRIRGILGNRIGKTMRKTPELIFYLDDSLDYAEKIDELLRG